MVHLAMASLFPVCHTRDDDGRMAVGNSIQAHCSDEGNGMDQSKKNGICIILLDCDDLLREKELRLISIESKTGSLNGGGDPEQSKLIT